MAPRRPRYMPVMGVSTDKQGGNAYIRKIYILVKYQRFCRVTLDGRAGMYIACRVLRRTYHIVFAKRICDWRE